MVSAARLLRRVLFVVARPAVGVAFVLCLAFAVGSAFAQSVECRHWVTYGSPALDVHGTQAQACAAWATLNATTVTSCGPVEPVNGLRVEYAGGATYITDAGPGTGCTPDPEDPEDPPATVPLDWSNTAHLMQALLVCFCVALFAHGFSAGNRL